MTTLQRLAGIVLLSAMAWPASAQAPSGNSVPVTAENFVRAESDLYLSTIDAQTVIRMNRDTLYSAAVFDLDAGPATITLPDAGKRFMSLQLISQDEYSPPAKYGKGKYVITRKLVGTRYVLVGVRTLVDPSDPADIAKVHALQDAIKVEQKSAGKFEVPKWDPVSQKKVRDALIVLGTTHRHQPFLRYQGSGRPDPALHLRSDDLGRQPPKGRHLSQLHPVEERRQHDLQAERQECAGRRLLVHQPL